MWQWVIIRQNCDSFVIWADTKQAALDKFHDYGYSDEWTILRKTESPASTGAHHLARETNHAMSEPIPSDWALDQARAYFTRRDHISPLALFLDGLSLGARHRSSHLASILRDLANAADERFVKDDPYRRIVAEAREALDAPSEGEEP